MKPTAGGNSFTRKVNIPFFFLKSESVLDFSNRKIGSHTFVKSSSTVLILEEYIHLCVDVAVWSLW